MNPGLARYATFAGFSSPLHAAAAGGHAEIVMMLLEKGANVNLKNICGHTPLMEACCSGRWEVVQILLLFRCNVSKVELLSGRTALHFASAGGHARCIRLLAADLCPGFSLSTVTDSLALTRFINKAANGGITALHLAALNGHSDCVHLLLDLHANISATTLSYASSPMAIGAGSSPLHYAACGGNLKCCQVLLARGASRTAMNCNGWLPVDVARICGSHWLIPLLTPHSSQLVPVFPPSNYLPLPLMSILQIARINGLRSSTSSCDESDLCAVCLERTCTVAAEGCGHELCARCALCLCSTSSIDSEMSAPPGSVPCPLCRKGIVSFVSLPTNEMEAGQSMSLCSKCSGHVDGQCQNPFATACGSELCRKNLFEIVPPVVCGGVSQGHVAMNDI
ncbi:E3 ubiquitin-protein ligase XBAT33-like isoform X2 [Curcuma longa]